MTFEHSRLLWRCRRGMLELDLLLQGFVEQGYDGLTVMQQRHFAQMLEMPDQQLLDYLMERLSPREPEVAELIVLIRHTIC